MIVTEKALDSTAPAVLGNNEIVNNFNPYKNIDSKGAAVLFYPKDFTFVCPSEIIAFDKRYDEFKKRGIEVMGILGNNEFPHFAWKNTPINQGGIGQAKSSLVADLTKQIVRNFDVLSAGAVAFRGSFLLDADGIVRHAMINDLPLGRNIDGMLRTTDTMLSTNEHGEACPVGWNKGDEGMKTGPRGVAEYLGKNENKL